MRYGKCSEHHRGLRPGHVSKGVAWELGRANCLLAQVTVRESVHKALAHEARIPRPSCEPWKRSTKVDGDARYQVRIANSERT